MLNRLPVELQAKIAELVSPTDFRNFLEACDTGALHSTVRAYSDNVDYGYAPILPAQGVRVEPLLPTLQECSCDHKGFINLIEIVWFPWLDPELFCKRFERGAINFISILFDSFNVSDHADSDNDDPLRFNEFLSRMMPSSKVHLVGMHDWLPLYFDDIKQTEKIYIEDCKDVTFDVEFPHCTRPPHLRCVENLAIDNANDCIIANTDFSQWPTKSLMLNSTRQVAIKDKHIKADIVQIGKVELVSNVHLEATVLRPYCFNGFTDEGNLLPAQPSRIENISAPNLISLTVQWLERFPSLANLHFPRLQEAHFKHLYQGSGISSSLNDDTSMLSDFSFLFNVRKLTT